MDTMRGSNGMTTLGFEELDGGGARKKPSGSKKVYRNILLTNFIYLPKYKMYPTKYTIFDSFVR